ncbi:MAG: F0F1 ATP synthase subunit alpha [Candidatus Lambdaproteobacteria bacterium]|nr:F0F1 ATP synthase subunit alpha [Candidatus Lambdaproteobacteria bacterium]
MDVRPEQADSPLAMSAALLRDYRFGLRVAEQGHVVSVGDGVAWIEGLPSAAMEEMLLMEDGSRAMVYHLTQRMVGAILLRQMPALTAGTAVHPSGLRLTIPVGDPLIGRVVDPLGAPLDAKPAPHCTSRRLLDGPAPPIVARDTVHRPLYTGNKIVDTMIPIGQGQRQLILGDTGTGKSTLALDTVIAQQGRNVFCVVVLIGQNRATVVETIEALQAHGALAHSVVVVAEATASPGLKFLAPYAGCAIAEHWMHMGRNTLVIYDDLTTHAQAYRELSLLLRHPPGREAYPGDVFHIHARLLERSTCLSAGAGGGSMTALPLAETELGEIAAFIPTNLISITDGQLYLDHGLFAGGFLPAIDIRKSVSRIGGKAQHPRIKEEAGRIKLDFLQFLELETFTRFGGRLEAETARKIHRGRVLRKLLLQDKRDPKSIEFQLTWLIAYNEGLLERMPLERIDEALERLQRVLAGGTLAVGSGRARWVEEIGAALRNLAGDP